MQLFGSEGKDKHGDGKKAEPEKRPVDRKGPVVGRRVVVRRLLTDGFDLFIPGHITSWIHTTPAFVGFASMVSTLLASKEIWDRLSER